ncbi:MAG: galactokinase [Pseudomonadota bacterium]
MGRTTNMTIDAFFREAFGVAPMGVGQARARVNLIGEHTDYNGGRVMPMGLPLTTHIAVSTSDDAPNAISGQLDVISERFGTASRALNEEAKGDWSDHVLGALKTTLHEHGAPLQGRWRVAILSEAPHGAGLSSSAALGVALIKAVDASFKKTRADKDVARLAQYTENKFLGVPCGIMDQFAAAHLAPGECMALDTASMAFEQLPVPSSWRFVVCHSGESRDLGDGRYAERRADCETAARHLGVSHLCQATHLPDAAESAMGVQAFRRARHVLTENARVSAALTAMANEDAIAMGRLMDESHASMRDDFVITTPGIDAIVNASRAAGAVGARMTGGGFGGCIVSLVMAKDVDAWRTRLESTAPKAQFIV